MTVATGPTRVYIEGWFGEGTAGADVTEKVTFRKSEGSGEVTPTSAKIVCPRAGWDKCYQAIECEVDFTEPEGEDYVGWWDVEVEKIGLFEGTFEKVLDVIRFDFYMESAKHKMDGREVEVIAVGETNRATLDIAIEGVSEETILGKKAQVTLLSEDDVAITVIVDGTPRTVKPGQKIFDEAAKPYVYQLWSRNLDAGLVYRADKPGAFQFKVKVEGVEPAVKTGTITAIEIMLFGTPSAWRRGHSQKPTEPYYSERKDGNNRFPYSDKITGKCYVSFWAKVPSGMWERLKARYGVDFAPKVNERVKWSLENYPQDQGVTITAQPCWKGETDKAEGLGSKKKRVHLILNGLPNTNSGLGGQTLMLEILDKDGNVVTWVRRQVRVFFSGTLKGHPTVAGMSSDATNWYYYWASNVGGPCDYTWTAGTKYMGWRTCWDASGSPDPKPWAFFDPSTSKEYFNNLKTDRDSFPKRFHGYHFGPYQPTGVTWTVEWHARSVVDFVNYAIAHEETHHKVAEENSKPATNDDDGDGVPDTWEDGIPGMKHANPLTDKDSFAFPSKYSGKSGAYRDNEFYAWVCGTLTFGVKSDGTLERMIPSGWAQYENRAAAPADADESSDWSVSGHNWMLGD